MLFGSIMPHDSAALQRVYFIRHGETAWSLSGQHTGRTDVPLTPAGEAEAGTLAGRLAGLTFEAVWSSPLQRARQTCVLAGLGTQMTVDPDLYEWDYGDYEGLRLAEIYDKRPDWNIFLDGCPHGETPADVAARVDRVIARARAVPGDVALCSHGHLGRALAARWLGLAVAHGGLFVLGTASVSVLGYAHDRVAEPAIVQWNLTP